MSQPGEDVTAERERLFFGAGFAFGVMFTMLILAVVMSAVVRGSVSIETLLSSTVVVPIVAAFVLAGIVGVALYVFALPERGFGLVGRAVLTDNVDSLDGE
jgi:hypothetical protein